jgi:adenosylcobinamide-GDP ribazoletransferase
LTPLRAFNGALSLLTTVPTPNFYPDKPGRAYACFPLVGLLIGGLLSAVAWGAGQVVPPNVTAFGVLLAWVLITGGLHLDGFGDACDGLFAAVPVERRLEIMKDPRAGSWAVIGLVLLLLGKWSALTSLPVAALVVAPVVARTVAVMAAFALPYARSGGMGGYYRDGLGWGEVAVAVMICAVVIVLFSSLWVAAVIGLMGAVLVAWWAARRLGGGLTGDVYGALIEVTELVILLAAAI